MVGPCRRLRLPLVPGRTARPELQPVAAEALGSYSPRSVDAFRDAAATAPGRSTPRRSGMAKALRTSCAMTWLPGDELVGRSGTRTDSVTVDGERGLCSASASTLPRSRAEKTGWKRARRVDASEDGVHRRVDGGDKRVPGFEPGTRGQLLSRSGGRPSDDPARRLSPRVEVDPRALGRRAT